MNRKRWYYWLPILEHAAAPSQHVMMLVALRACTAAHVASLSDLHPLQHEAAEQSGLASLRPPPVANLSALETAKVMLPSSQQEEEGTGGHSYPLESDVAFGLVKHRPLGNLDHRLFISIAKVLFGVGTCLGVRTGSRAAV